MKICLIAALFCSLAAQAAGPDIVVADFEQTDYRGWTATGEAFGTSPAHGALPGQMSVSGYEGKGLVNSFLHGDDSTGTLTSPSFKVERRYLRFLIGGGNYPGETCVNLLSAGRIVRTATGSNSEHLDPFQWDVAELAGQLVTLEIVDQRKGGWGHINVDQVVQTDSGLPQILSDAKREIRAEKKYLNLPIKNGAPKRLLTIAENNKIVRQFTIELADGAPDWWAFLDIAPFHGQTLTLSVDRLKEDSKALAAIDQSDNIKGAENLYREALRPQFHFTARRGWNNDPNGLVFYKGEYHLFFQHNPYGVQWGNMHWGHAVSPDLVHWKELDEALYPDELGTMFSGSAVVDEHNTSGLQKGAEKTLVAFYTAAGGDDPLSKGKQFSQCMAYSNDRGRTWVKYEHNPVVPHVVGGNRDPKVLWYAPQNKWLMALYLDQSDFAIFDSKDLKTWNQISKVTIPGTSECPEFFEIPVEGRHETRWVFYGGNGRYLVGKFDGKNFTSESGPHELNRGNCFYASQTYNLPPADKRRILVPWSQINIPGMPFNQMIGLPVELKLKPGATDLLLTAEPVREFQRLRQAGHSVTNKTLKADQPLTVRHQSDLLETVLDLTPGKDAEISIAVRGILITYDSKKQELSCLGKKAPLAPNAGTIQIRFLLDRTSIDIFANHGDVYMPMGFIPKSDDRTIVVTSRNTDSRINAFSTYDLKSSWETQK
jgi:fructan beta-fructosidase